MPKGKKNKDPGAKSKRKKYRRLDYIASLIKKPAISHQFKPGHVYHAAGVQYKADKGGSLRRIQMPTK